MARLFDDAASEYLEKNVTVRDAEPLTMACWFNCDDTDNNGFTFINGTSSGSAWELRVLGTVSNRIRFVTNNVNTDSAAGGPFWTTGVWSHMAAVVVASTDRSVFLDGAAKITSTDDVSPATANELRISASSDSAGFFSGSIAEPAIWDVALSDLEVGLLAKGLSPLFIQPDSLVFYAPLIRDEDFDKIGGVSLSAINTPSVATHPPKIKRPAPPFISYPTAAAVAVEAVAIRTQIPRTIQIMPSRESIIRLFKKMNPKTARSLNA